MRIIGRVESGIGDARRWLAKFNTAYSRKTGMPIYPGSLNLRLAESLDWRTPAIEAVTIKFAREEYGGERDILLVPCRLPSLDDRDAFLWTTTRVLSDPEPAQVIEVIASIGLRAAYALEDGDLIELEVVGARPHDPG